MQNREIAIPQGKVVGGSSVLNGMAFDRGSAADYDAWADLGNPGWTFKELLPYFKKVYLVVFCLRNISHFTPAG
jgi:choline dehydrogenase-like flavoprotein